MGKTSIEWTQNPDGSKGKTWNPTRGCSRQSDGCLNCYAMRQAHRFDTISPASPYHGLTTIRAGKVDWAGMARFIPEQLGAPLKWRKPTRIFVNSMSDLFHPSLTDEQIAAVFAVMAACPQHTFQVLTKQPKRAAEWFKVGEELTAQAGERLAAENGWCHANEGEHWPLPNVWLGTSAENQETYNARVPTLVHGCPAALHFVSLEPMLGPIKLRGTGHIHLGWVIIGGESGHGARPFDVAWAKSLVVECRENSIPAFVKQLGAKPYEVIIGKGRVCGPCSIDIKDRAGGDPSEWTEQLRVREFPEAR